MLSHRAILLTAAVFVANTQSQADSAAPRLELTLGPNPAGAYPGFTLTLTLVNESKQPVEAPLSPIVPRLWSEDGKRIVFSDRRNLAGYAMPELPRPPNEPVRPGERRELGRYPVIDAGNGPALGVPFGSSGQLAAGRYRIQASAVMVAVSREDWISQYIVASRISPGQTRRGETGEQAAVHAAARYAAHWAELGSFWTGHLDSNVLELAVPSRFDQR